MSDRVTDEQIAHEALAYWRHKHTPADDYEGGVVSEGAEADDGSQYSVSVTSPVVYSDFDFTAETQAATFTRSATAAVPWTWRHFFEHVRASEPFLVADGTDNTVHLLRPDAAGFRPTRTVANWNDRWDISLATIVEGRL